MAGRNIKIVSVGKSGETFEGLAGPSRIAVYSKEALHASSLCCVLGKATKCTAGAMQLETVNPLYEER